MIFLVLLFIIVPLAELYVIIQVGGSIGVGPTIFILLLDSLLGAFLLRHQGRAAWVSFNRALAENRVPHKEALDGVLVIFGAALLLTPGFITDIFGLILLIPPTRAMIRGAVKWLAVSRLSMGPKAAFFGLRGYGRVRDRRAKRGPGPEPADAGAPPRDARGGAEDFSWTTPAGPRPGDIEGTAQEVRDDDQALPPGKSTSFPGMSDRAALICSFWDEAAELAGLAWNLDTPGGLLWRDGELATATAEIDDRGKAVGVRLEAAGQACEAELTAQAGEVRLAAEGEGDEATAAACAAAVSAGAGAGNGRTARGSGELTRWPHGTTEGGGLLRHLVVPAPDGAVLVLVSRGPSGVRQDEERTSAWLLGPEGGATNYREALLSTQYDGGGLQTRAGLELWSEDEEAPPMRAAGTTLGQAPADDRQGVAAALLRSSAEGLKGLGSYLIWRG